MNAGSGEAVTITVRFFAAARQAAGTGALPMRLGTGATVGDVLDAVLAGRDGGDGAVGGGGDHRAALAVVLPTCRVWRNGDAAQLDERVADGDEVAILPPVSGGCAPTDDRIAPWGGDA